MPGYQTVLFNFSWKKSVIVVWDLGLRTVASVRDQSLLYLGPVREVTS